MIDWEKCSLGLLMLIMKSRTRTKLVPFALCAMGLAALFLAGCRKEEKASEKSTSETNVPSFSPASYMNDPVFRKQLSDKRKELQSIVKERAPLVKRMEELVKEHGQDLAALQKIDEWNELHKKVVALNAKYEEARARQLKVVRERIAPKSGEPKSGEATSPSLQGKSGRSGETPLPRKDISK